MPVLVAVMVTCAFGTDAPDESTIVPRSDPLTACEKAKLPHNVTSRRRIQIERRFCINLNPLFAANGIATRQGRLILGFLGQWTQPCIGVHYKARAWKEAFKFLN
jgi:hypothetical protein